CLRRAYKLKSRFCHLPGKPRRFQDETVGTDTPRWMASAETLPATLMAWSSMGVEVLIVIPQIVRERHTKNLQKIYQNFSNRPEVVHNSLQRSDTLQQPKRHHPHNWQGSLTSKRHSTTRCKKTPKTGAANGHASWNAGTSPSNGAITQAGWFAD
ncbi:MAG: hypothetical protein ACMV1D_08975, partial [Macromonas sp.]